MGYLKGIDGGILLIYLQEEEQERMYVENWLRVGVGLLSVATQRTSGHQEAPLLLQSAFSALSVWFLQGCHVLHDPNLDHILLTKKQLHNLK